jgi:hypothetical protein
MFGPDGFLNEVSDQGFRDTTDCDVDEDVAFEAA